MDPVDYWLMAREYSIWNAAVAALQFWTGDLKTHVLSSTIAVHLSTPHLHICYARSLMKYYLVTS